MHERNRHSVAHRAVWPELVIVSTPILHLCPRDVKGHEPVSVQALGAELAIKTLDVAVVSRLAWPGEVEHDTLVIGPKIKVSRDELAAVIDANGRRISDLPVDPLQCLNDILALVTEAGINRRREARVSVDDRQNPDLATSGQLVMNEIHRPNMVGMARLRAVSPQLRLDPALGNFVAELEVHLLVKAIDSLRVHGPAFTLDKNMHTPVAAAYPRLADILDLQLQLGLLATPGLVDIVRAVDFQHRACTPDRNLPVRLDRVDKLALAGRPQSFFESTSCSMALSRDRSATIRFSLAFSSSSCRSRFISEGIKPAYFLRQL